jgi:CTP-dependent riboflavin kinase
MVAERSSAGAPRRLTGTAAPGLGQGGGFVALDWVQRGFQGLLGRPPYAGTLNLDVAPEDVARLRAETPAVAFPAGAPGFCDAVVHRVEVDGEPALAVFPDVEAYPPDKLELVLSRRLPVGVGDRVTISW